MSQVIVDTEHTNDHDSRQVHILKVETTATNVGGNSPVMSKATIPAQQSINQRKETSYSLFSPPNIGEGKIGSAVKNQDLIVGDATDVGAQAVFMSLSATGDNSPGMQ